MGLFNDWVRGTWLEPLEARDVVAVSWALLPRVTAAASPNSVGCGPLAACGAVGVWPATGPVPALRPVIAQAGHRGTTRTFAENGIARFTGYLHPTRDWYGHSHACEHR